MRALAAALAVITGGLLTGCAGSAAQQTARATTQPTNGAASQPVARHTSNGAGPLVVPMTAKEMHDLELHLYGARFLSPTRLAIPGISGSSNCPSVPAELVARSPHAIWVDLVVGSWRRTGSGLRVRVPHSPGMCLDDLVPTPVVIAIDPKQIDVHHQLKVSLYYPKAVIRRYKRPVVFTVPPFATPRIREDVKIARSSNPRLFSIFPKAPGERLCAIPDIAPRPRAFAGVCQTNVRPRPTHEPSVIVTFTESWSPKCPAGAYCPTSWRTRHHTWQVVEGRTILKPGTKPHVYATHSRGARAPQDPK